MNESELDRSRSDVLQVFPLEGPEGKVCAWVFERLEQLGSQFDSVTLGDIALAMAWSSDVAKLASILRALDFLSLSEIQLLDRQFEIFDDLHEDDIIESPSQIISNEEIREALRTGSLQNPKTGMDVENFMERVSIRYIVSDKAKSLVKGKASHT